MTLREAVGTVLEGFTLPPDVRKILEEAYFNSPINPTIRVRGWVWKEDDDGLFSPSYTPAQPMKDNKLFALVDPRDLNMPLENTDWFYQDIE